MTRYLKNESKKYFLGRNFESEDIYQIGTAPRNEELRDDVITQSITSVSGATIVYNINHQFESELYRTKKMNLEINFVNSSGTDAPTMKNPWAAFKTLQVQIDELKLPELDTHQILLQVADSLNQQDTVSKVYKHMSNFRTEIGETLNGETIGTSSSLLISYDLFLVFPFLKDYINQGYFKQVSFKIVMQDSVATAATLCKFFVSNTTSIPYSTNITISTMKMVRLVQYTNESVLLKEPSNITLVYPNFKSCSEVYTSKSWNVPGTDKLIVDLNKVFLPYDIIQGVSFSLFPTGLISAYNDADSCKFYSGAKYVGYKILWKNRVILDLTGDANKQRRYEAQIDHFKNKYASDIPNSCLTYGDNLAFFYYQNLTYVDFNLLKTESQDDFPVSGIHNKLKEYTVEFTCETAVSTNCELFVHLHIFQGLRNTGKQWQLTPS